MRGASESLRVKPGYHDDADTRLRSSFKGMKDAIVKIDATDRVRPGAHKVCVIIAYPRSIDIVLQGICMMARDIPCRLRIEREGPALHRDLRIRNCRTINVLSFK